MLSKEGKFELHFKGVPYKKLFTNKGHYYNKLTGEHLGSNVTLFKWYYDKNGQELPEPILDENCYEVIYD